MAAVGEVATLTDIVPLLDAHPFDLSGGELHRLSLIHISHQVLCATDSGGLSLC